MKFQPKQIEDAYSEDGSSAFLFDLRNSTEIIRKISWDKRLDYHIHFMMQLNEFVYTTLYNNCDENYFGINDTGDGYLCVFLDDVHAFTCLDIALRIKEYLEIQIPKHNENLYLKTFKLKEENQKIEKNIPKFDYGFGLHSGGSIIYRTKIDSRLTNTKDFIYGIVPNTVARLESFTKNYINYKFLITGNYKKNLKNQDSYSKINDLLKNVKSLGRVNLHDGKENGHNIYELNDKFISKFVEYYRKI